MRVNANRRPTLVGPRAVIAEAAIGAELGEPVGIDLERTTIADAGSTYLLAASPLPEQPA